MLNNVQNSSDNTRSDDLEIQFNNKSWNKTTKRITRKYARASDGTQFQLHRELETENHTFCVCCSSAQKGKDHY